MWNVIYQRIRNILKYILRRKINYSAMDNTDISLQHVLTITYYYNEKPVFKWLSYHIVIGKLLSWPYM